MNILDNNKNLIASVDEVTGKISQIEESALQVIFNSWQTAEVKLQELSIINNYLLKQLIESKK